MLKFTLGENADDPLSIYDLLPHLAKGADVADS